MTRKYISIKTVCEKIGGDKPVHPATYYRGVAKGIYPPPEHPSPGISRVVEAKLDAALDKLVARERCG